MRGGSSDIYGPQILEILGVPAKNVASAMISMAAGEAIEITVICIADAIRLTDEDKELRRQSVTRLYRRGEIEKEAPADPADAIESAIDVLSRNGYGIINP